MGLFTKTVVDEKKLEDAKLTHRLEKGKLNKEIVGLKSQVSNRDSKIEVLEAKVKDIQEVADYYMKLENDRENIEHQKKVIKVDREDIEEDKKVLEHKTKRLEAREKRLNEDENQEYKKGYSDGLADGLRKAHDITREDRKYLTMIAMSTNQSEAIKTSQKALEDGFKDDRTDSKS